MKRNLGALEDGADRDGELPTASVALVEALALLAFRVRGRRASASAFDRSNVLIPDASAVRADGSIGPALGFKMLSGSVFALKNWGI
ncbi:hypothetical protein HY36_11965 [Hyphomonas atlantica]|uniref:Uncharacterized protein n=1 Tax=Hyphomonas atlantica TaxID=1280948 RepID=A0A059DWY6_9PROT|nr:hypothetical protein HY36_11965 [Hyphomonas atlantica]